MLRESSLKSPDPIKFTSLSRSLGVVLGPTNTNPEPSNAFNASQLRQKLPRQAVQAAHRATPPDHLFIEVARSPPAHARSSGRRARRDHAIGDPPHHPSHAMGINCEPNPTTRLGFSTLEHTEGTDLFSGVFF